jgi:hypothetical protein
MKQQIIYSDNHSFYEGIKKLVENGLTFEANHESLVIVLKGGY